MIIVDKALEEVVTTSVNKLVQTVSDNVELVRGVDSEIKGLSDDIETFNARLLDAFKNPGANELHLLQVIAKKFRSVVNEAQDSIMEYVDLKKKHGEGCVAAYAWSCYDNIPVPFCGNVNACASKIKSIRTHLKVIRQDHEVDLRSLVKLEVPDIPSLQDGPIVEEGDMLGFEEDLKKVKGRLTEAPDSFNVVPIVGRPGIGKTTFANKIFKESSGVHNGFVHSVRVHVSQGFNLNQKLMDILNQISKDTGSASTLSPEMSKLKIREILGDKKYFVLMDDVWDKRHWDFLKAAFPKSKGSIVLVTTRDQSVADYIGKPHRLEKLKTEVCWLLLKKIVFGGKKCPSSFEEHGTEIAGKCDGLPLAIVVIAGILRKYRTVAEWRRVAANPSLEINQKNQIYHNIVMLSFNYLPHEKLKNCFLYFASFPMGHEISAWKLIRLWIAEELIPTKDEGGYTLDVEAQARKYLNDLVDRNLVNVSKRSADGQIKACCILDSLHEFCKNEAGKKDLFHVMDGRRTFDAETTTPRRLCFHSSIPDTFDAENNVFRSFGEHVHTLLLPPSQKSENALSIEKFITILNTFPFLRVLDIESYNFGLLPEKLYDQCHLRYLAITTDMDSLPNKQFKNLRGLETLVFRTNKRTLEISGGIWNMEKLRHVHTNTSAHLPSPPKRSKNSSVGSTKILTLSTISPASCTREIFSMTPNLQKLGVRGNLVELMEKKQLLEKNKETCLFDNLQNKLGVCGNLVELLEKKKLPEEKQETCLFDNLHNLICLENLKLHGQSEEVLKVSMPDKFPCRLRKLTLSNTLFDWNDISILALLYELEVLKLDENAFTGEFWDLDSNVIFKQLQYLRIGKSNLVIWTAYEDSFPALETIVLKSCTCLEQIPEVFKQKVVELFDGSEKAAKSVLKVRSVAEKDYVLGFEEDMKTITARLTEAPNNFVAISIVGMHGAGKTTFAKKIFEDPEVRSKFDHCIWIDVSKGFRKDQLECRIMKDQKYFIVLDEVWEIKAWDSLKAAFPENSRGISVLVTTRVRSVADYIGEPYCLPELSHDESWLLLEKKVYGEEESCEGPLRAIGRNIAARCNGLPLAIVMIARILRINKTIAVWEQVAENPFLQIYLKGGRYHTVVTLSYKILPNEMLKNCFIYFACFPFGQEISAWKLICLWIAEGFIPTTDGQGNTLDVEFEAWKYLDDLVDKNLVMVLKRKTDGQIKTCRVHDSLYEFCKIEATKKNILAPRICCHSSLSNKFVADDKQSRFHLSRYYKKRRRQSYYSEQAHSLLLSCPENNDILLTEEQLASILHTFPDLRVLDIESLKFSFLPYELSGLNHLKYLAITTDLEVFHKKFNNLRELETLVFKTTKSSLQINGGIWNMEKLRHVHTNTSAHLPFCPKTSKNNSGSLDIRTLSTISPASCTEEIFSKTPNLQKLGVRGNLAELLEEKQGICLFDNLQCLNCLENLKLLGQSSKKVLKVPALEKFPRMLRKLTLSNTWFEQNDMSILGSFDKLEVLKLDENAFTGERWDLSNDVVFKKLRYLRIGNTNLETWSATKDSFPVLETTVLRNCTLLEGIPYVFAGIQSLKVMVLFHVSKRAANSATEANKRRTNQFDLSITPLPSQEKARSVVDVLGFEDDLKTIKARLEVSNNFVVIPIAGKLGAGKTTLAKKVYEDPDIRNKFVHAIWVQGLQSFNRRKKFIDILDEVTGCTEDYSNMSEDQLGAKIQELLKDHRCLIAMDDVWEKKDWDSLKVAFPENSKGIRVLVTTRDRSVADYIGKPHSLQELSHEESWLLLEKKVFGADGCLDKSFEALGRQIAGRCNGLPLAIVIIARVLRINRTYADWERVAQNPFLEINRKDQSYHKLVMMSYDHLPHEKLRNCFLYFASFPMGHEIAAWKLIRLWIAEGYIPTIDESGSTLDMEAEAWKYLNHLVDKNLVMVLKRRADGQVKRCGIDECLREFCKSEAAGKNLFHIMDEGQILDVNTISSPRLCFHSAITNTFVAEKNPSRLFLSCINKKRSPYPSGEHVHSLLLMSPLITNSEVYLTIPYIFPLLRVLDIEPLKFSFLPNELFGLNNLRYLAITTDLSLLPKSFNNLHDLETLVFKTTKKRLEISGGIWNMNKLRHVHTNTSTHLPSPPKTSTNSSRSTNICTLSTISPASCTEEIFSKTPKLQKLGVLGNLAELLEEQQGICLFNNLQRLNSLVNLKLHGESEMVLKVPQRDKFPCRLRKLTLSNTLFEWNDISILGSLEELIVLKLDENAFAGEHWHLNDYVVFGRLQYLRVATTNLKSWTVAENSFPVLESLVLRRCINLEEIPCAFANLDSLKVIYLFDVSEQTVNSAKKAKEQRLGRKDVNTRVFDLVIYPPPSQATDYEPIHGDENVNTSESDLPNTSFPSQEYEQIHGDENVNTTEFDLPNTTFPSQIEYEQTHVEENVNTTNVDLPSTFSLSQAPVVGFDDEVKIIVEHLIGGYRGLEVISIVGMVGLGKTTLAEMVFNSNEVRYHFEIRIWVYVSASFDRRRIFIDILRNLTTEIVNFDHMSEEMSHECIYKCLKGKRYFIVLDDVQTAHAWDYSKIIFPDDWNGSRVLITTRYRHVASYAAPDNYCHHLRFLTKDESWELLQKKTFGNEMCPPPLETLGRIISIKCEGLPLLVVLMAGILRKAEKTAVIWKQITENLQEGEKITGILRSSYDHLPYDLKYCFLYLAAFPREYEIAVWKLIRLWIAEGFISGMEGGYTSNLEQTAEKYLEDLVDRNLLIVRRRRADGQIKACHMHGIWYDFCKTEAASENLFQEIDGASFKRNIIPHRLCVNSSVLDFLTLESKPSAEHVRSFLSFRSEEMQIPNEHSAVIPKSFPLLRVMDVESFMFKKLPNELFHLYHLRYLAISTDQDILSRHFEYLCNLQTLVLNTTARKSLKVQVEIWSMPRLRHVHSNTSLQLPPPSKIRKDNLGSTDIQTLSTISPSSCTREILDKTPNLQKLGIRGNLAEFMKSKGVINLFNNLKSLNCLENLKLLNEAAFHGQAGRLAGGFPPTLRKLTLSNTLFPWEDMRVLAVLPNLEVLKLEKDAFRGEIWELEDDDIVFGRLKFLRIGRTDLKSWHTTDRCFPVLEKLVIRDCTRLEELPHSFAEIETLQLLELDCTTPSAESSAREIQEEQRDLGNFDFTVIIRSRNQTWETESELDSEL